MTNKNQWEILRRGDAEQALDIMRDNFIRHPSPSYIMELGVGYLWSAKYRAAWEHIEHVVQVYPLSTDSFFGMAGAAKWCAGEPDGAVMMWKSGLGAQFADAAGGVHLPLLLWVASVLRENVSARDEAARILRKKVSDPRVKYWPGALAEFVLNLIDEKALEERSIERISREIPPRQKWLIAFYKSVVEYERGDVMIEKFKDFMREITDTSVPEWSEERAFLSLTWNPEFFLARHESHIADVPVG